MQIKISARHGHLGESVQEHIRSKAEKLLHLFELLGVHTNGGGMG